MLLTAVLLTTQTFPTWILTDVSRETDSSKREVSFWAADFEDEVNIITKETELVSTLAKNATKQNPFEILLLQTTRKENSWKTEETLERAVVTLET